MPSHVTTARQELWTACAGCSPRAPINSARRKRWSGVRRRKRTRRRQRNQPVRRSQSPRRSKRKLLLTGLHPTANAAPVGAQENQSGIAREPPTKKQRRGYVASTSEEDDESSSEEDEEDEEEEEEEEA